ncbi:MAG: hypothetical protein V4805_05305 [Pseudomonadota bacterium]
MDNFIFDKTDKGREEIATRKHGVASRLRSLLVLIDGKKSTPELLQKVGGLGLDVRSLIELLEGEFIENIAPESLGDAPQNMPSDPAEAAAMADLAAMAADINASAAAQPSVPREPGQVGKIGADQIIALQTFFNETIKSTVGLRGFTLQLKVERAFSIEEFRALRQPYLEAVLKAKGNEMARSLRDRLDQLLELAEKSIK